MRNKNYKKNNKIINYFLIILMIPLLFLIYFYRNPNNKIIKNNFDKVYSPGYGTILKIDDKIVNGEEYKFIAIFLSPFDVHYQYSPVSGKITNIKSDHTGKYNLAYELNKSNDNEKVIYTITNNHGKFYVYQIAGYYVRRISTFVEKNTDVETGEKLGIIHFGSRVDILIPKKNFILNVKENDKVKGTNTLLGYYK